LNKTYGEWKNNKTTICTAENDTIELPIGIYKRKRITNVTRDTEDEGNDLDTKVFRAMRETESWFNPQATKVVEDHNHEREMKLDHVNLALLSTEKTQQPMKKQLIVSKRKTKLNGKMRVTRS
jgi:predicted oxidoreductase (fatty acid repression mutant protein)